MNTVTTTKSTVQPITKIGIITNTYPPMRNGVSMAVFGLEQSLKSKGIEVFIVTPALDGVVYSPNICPLPSTDIPSTISGELKLPRGYIKTCRKFFGDNGVQLIHTHDTLFGGIEGAFVSNDLKIPCVHTFHTMIQQYNLVKFPAYKTIIKQAIIEVCNSYQNVISPSQKVYDYLLDLGVMSPITQIYNVPYLNNMKFVDTNRFEANFKVDFDNNLNTDNGFTFLSFCRLSSEKGVDIGINVLAPILQTNPKIRYVIAGDGPEKAGLIELTKSLKIDKQVFFVGSYAPSELESLVKTIGAKAFLFTSLSENLPTNILEAAYLGLPIVAIDDKSVDYIVKDGHNGYKQPLNNLTQICQNLIDNPELTQELSANAKATAQEFVTQDIAQKHIQLYNNVVDMYNKNQEDVGYQQFRLGSIFDLVDKLVQKIKEFSKI